MQDFLTQKPIVLNIGLSLFSNDLGKQDVSVAQVNWAPSPAFQKDDCADVDAQELLDGLL